MEPLAPYPAPSKKQDRVVRRVEIFANVLKKTSQVITIPFYPISKLKTKIVKRTWKKRAQAVPKDELIPPQDSAVYVANSTHAMDHNFFYILKNGRLWFKPIAAPLQSKWLLFGPDGLPPSGLKLTLISSDGRNLVAIDETGTINYVNTDHINVVITDNNWIIQNIKLEWKERWFAIPLINKIVELLRDKHLKLPQNCNSCSISQKGPETGYYTDMSGKKQPEFLVGVTTLYVLCKDGRIYFADPWLGNGFCNELTAPEDGQFVAEIMAAAASTIFLLRRDETGKPLMYTRFADFDNTGSNPLLPATHDPDNQIPLVRRLPAEDWTKQPEIPLENLARLTSEISIIQIGRGQNNRQLRVEGTNSNGEPGYYFKRIYEDKWHFELTPNKLLDFTKPLHLIEPPSPPVDLDGQIFTRKENISLKQVTLKKFLRHGLNERGLHTVVELTLNNERKLALPLFAHRGLVHLFGQRNNLPYWQLIMPKEYKLEMDIETKNILKTIFKNKMVVSVSVNELRNGDIEISNKHRRFKFEFKATPPTEILYSSHDTNITNKPAILSFPQNNIPLSRNTKSKNNVEHTVVSDRVYDSHKYYVNGSSRVLMFSNADNKITENKEQSKIQNFSPRI